MSAKWVRSKQWDDRHLTGPLLPVKFVLQALSSIWLSVTLLSMVAVYGILASVPVGLLALIPTVIIYGLVAVALFLGICAVPTYLVEKKLRARKAGRGTRTLTAFGMGGVLLAIAIAAWVLFVWPRLKYTSVHEGETYVTSGFRLFAGFVEKYQAVQFRRLPIMEMSELEFYSWWPLRVILLVFVLNMTIATVRRIVFKMPQIGVLTVHTGIIVIALGSAYYASNKQEGDMALLAASSTGDSSVLRERRGFYDNTDSAIWVSTDGGAMGEWAYRSTGHVPRYNHYNLSVVERGTAGKVPAWAEDFGPLDIGVAEHQGATNPRGVAPDIDFRIVGYAPYAELVPALVAAPAGQGQRVRTAVVESSDGQQAHAMPLMPDVPAKRFGTLEVLSIEYTRGMSEQRWSDLKTTLTPNVKHSLIVEVPGARSGAGGGQGYRQIIDASQTGPVAIGDTGYTVTVRQLMKEPPMPIVTKGYEGALSSLAVVEVQPPIAVDGTKPPVFQRWVYHRFPEISQDLSSVLNDRGMPTRSNADPAIRISYIDAENLQVYIDEREDGTSRAMLRFFGRGDPLVVEGLKPGETFQIAPTLKVKLGPSMDAAREVSVPMPVPPEAQDKQQVGNHSAAAVAVEIAWGQRTAGEKMVVWLPFTKYVELGEDTVRRIELPDGRKLALAFGRVFHEFRPSMGLTMAGFEMTPYPHSDVPKDYRSDLVVSTTWGESGRAGEGRQELLRRTSLNEPLLVRTPFVGRDDLREPLRTTVNTIGWAMSLVSPNQYKFSQAGWDASGWRETAAMAKSGLLPEPRARFTILGVGNNPGIYLIAAGAVMMSIGIPWAFYLKPWLVKRQKVAIQRQLLKEGKLPRGVKVDGMGGGQS